MELVDYFHGIKKICKYYTKKNDCIICPLRQYKCGAIHTVTSIQEVKELDKIVDLELKVFG